MGKSESAIMNVKSGLAAVGLVVAAVCVTAAQEPKQGTSGAANQAGDENAIRAVSAAFVRAYNAGNSEAMAALFTDDAEVVNEDGVPVQGREAIAALFASTFATHPGETIELDEISVRFLGPDAAQEKGRARILPGLPRPGVASREKSPSVAPAGASQANRYTVLFVRQGGRWLQSSVHEHADKEISSHERLVPLEWLLGEWVDEGSSSVIHSNTRWSDDGNFLLRDFTIQVGGQAALNGSQRIGWDPLTRQITSWVFDSEGGHGVGLWARDGNRWVVKASGVLRDGRTATVTQIYTVVNPLLVRWKSVDRTVGDQVEPDGAELVMVRKPPRPR
jgi:uncharacterized protein (TIGR02246 family)